MIEVLIIQSEPEKQDKNQISGKNFENWWDFALKFSNASDFETKISQLVQLWLKNLISRQILHWQTIKRVRFWIKKFYVASDFQ